MKKNGDKMEVIDPALRYSDMLFWTDRLPLPLLGYFKESVVNSFCGNCPMIFPGLAQWSDIPGKFRQFCYISLQPFEKNTFLP